MRASPLQVSSAVICYRKYKSGPTLDVGTRIAPLQDWGMGMVVA